jgi:NlpC/P60 family putative phage cell wall peptidase
VNIHVSIREPVAAARDIVTHGCVWRHRGRDVENGLDWLGFLRAVHNQVRGYDPPDLSDYEPSWLPDATSEMFLEHLETWPAFKVRNGKVYPGDILLFRMAPGRMIAHGAINLGEDRIAHSYWGRAPTISRLSTFWRERVAQVLTWQ